MNRAELVRRFVLDEIMDDYESPEHIHESLAGHSRRCGVHISMQEVYRGLGELIETGLARAYRFTGTSRAAEEIVGVPTAEGMTENYFWATPKGIELQTSDSDWYPFDDKGQLRKGWTPPDP